MVNVFYVGDKVKVTVFSQGGEGTIIASSLDGKYYVVEFFDKNGDPFTYSYAPHEIIKIESFLTKCECGAVYTWAPNQHSTWCPRWMI